MNMPETEPELLSLSLKLWHPGCWTTEVTTATGASVLGHGSVVSDTGVWERCTLTGQSPEHVEQAVAVARESSRIGGLEPLGDRPAPCERSGSAVDTYAQDVVIEYDYSEGIGPALSARGFVLDGVSRMEDGTETWPLLVHGCRSRLQDVLDGIRRRQDATISVERVECAGAGRRETPVEARLDELTARQREVFELARERGYYEWPRGTSVADLADELGVSEPTVLEHQVRENSN
ncbi:bacterio-opsin activator [Halobacteriales archaeon QS_1_68_17]|nr:MAG: bacterio-opsin activator [Halobacteriales archaeon QS_1_68_17]